MRTVLPILLLTSALWALGAEPSADAKNKTPAVVAAPESEAGVVGTGSTNAAGKSGKEYLSTTVVDPETRELKPRDGFRFSIEEDPPPTLGGGSPDGGGVYISDGGEAMFPVSRSSTIYLKLTVAGKKLADVRKELKARLDAEYYKNCTIHLDLVQVNRGSAAMDQSARVTIYGELSGVLPIGEGETMTISDAMLRVGRSEDANMKKIKIHRLDKETNKEKIITVDVDKILKQGDRTHDEVLKGGDRIEVLARGFF
jgi:protein involved in polysaccharide export with SLBB domain